MKIKCLFLTALLLTLVSIGFAQSKAPQATFESANVVHQVKYKDKLWMRIDVTFRVTNALNVPSRLSAHFYNDTDGEALEGDSANYSEGGYVTSGRDFTSNLNDGVYKNFQLYIPYEALSLQAEKGDRFDLKFFLNVRDTSSKKGYAKSGWYKFTVQY